MEIELAPVLDDEETARQAELGRQQAVDAGLGGARLLAAHLVNLEAIGKLSRRMQPEWRRKEPALVQMTHRCAVLPGPRGAVMVVFLDIPVTAADKARS